MSEHDHSHELKQNRSSLGSPVTWCISLLTLYVLSPQPIFLCLQQMPKPMSNFGVVIWRFVYFPLVWIYGQIDFVRDFYDAYARMLGM